MAARSVAVTGRRPVSFTADAARRHAGERRDIFTILALIAVFAPTAVFL
jgi:hypothetical protein